MSTDAPNINSEERFTLELEFVTSLANPWYINFLAQQSYFQEESFINYLEYLLYWKEPPYCKYINYPIALYFLDLLQQASFRENIKHQENVIFLHEKQYYHWLYNKKANVILKEIDDKEEGDTEARVL